MFTNWTRFTSLGRHSAIGIACIRAKSPVKTRPQPMVKRASPVSAMGTLGAVPCRFDRTGGGKTWGFSDVVRRSHFGSGWNWNWTEMIVIGISWDLKWDLIGSWMTFQGDLMARKWHPAILSNTGFNRYSLQQYVPEMAFLDWPSLLGHAWIPLKENSNQENPLKYRDAISHRHRKRCQYAEV